MFNSDFENEPSNRYLPSDFEIEHMTDDPESLAYGFYSILAEYENHYNNIQSKFRGLAITWMIASFIAIGYLVTGYESGITINKLIIVFFLSLLTSLGIFLIWFLDAGVYHQLVECIWSEEYELEEKFPILGKAHHLALKFVHGQKECKKFQGTFYSYFIISFLFISVICLSLYLYLIDKWLIGIVLFVFVVLLFFILRHHKNPLFFKEKDKKK